MILTYLALKTGARPLMRRYVDGAAYARHLRSLGYAIGEDCSIPTDAVLPNPGLIRIGSNVRMSNGVSLLTYEGSIAMLNRAYGKRLDRVGPIVIRDNVFIGKGAVIKYGVTLGPNVVVGAHSVVTKSYNNAIVAGNPARQLMTCDDFVAKVDREAQAYPWYDVIASRTGACDPALEPTLNAARVRHFFPEEADEPAPAALPYPILPAMAFA